jgi:UDP-N-acetylmuramoyl-tripeptide--D-alanyl-D-alanine ligase
MNHPGEIAPLAELARPSVAVVLNVLPVHRAHFPDVDAIRKEKVSIYKGLVEKGELILEDSISAAGVPDAVPIRRFGQSPDADVRLLEVSGQEARYLIDGERVSARVPGGGRHRAMTLAAVLCVMRALALRLDPAIRLTDDLIPSGRGRQHKIGGITVIDDSYNANPDSVQAALSGLAADPANRRFALLGDMLELGAESADFHRALAPFTTSLDGVLCVGAAMRALHDALPGSKAMGWQAEADDALLERLVGLLRTGDTLLVKGSNRVFWVHRFVARLLDRLAERHPGGL